MPDTTPAAAEAPPDLSRFDDDPDALAWARAKIQHVIDRATRFEQQARGNGLPDTAETWRRTASYLRLSFIGGEGCVIASFDHRLPELRRLMEDPGEVAW